MVPPGRRFARAVTRLAVADGNVKDCRRPGRSTPAAAAAPSPSPAAGPEFRRADGEAAAPAGFRAGPAPHRRRARPVPEHDALLVEVWAMDESPRVRERVAYAAAPPAGGASAPCRRVRITARSQLATIMKRSSGEASRRSDNGSANRQARMNARDNSFPASSARPIAARLRAVRSRASFAEAR